MTPAEVAEFTPGYRYPDNESVPDYLRGKTVAEAHAALEANMVEPAPSPAPPPPAAGPPANGNGQYATREQFHAIATQQAAVALDLARQKHPDVFGKWPGEVAALLGGVAPESLTVEMFSRAALMVKANHLDEIIAERVRASAMPMHAAFRSTGGGGPMTTPQKPVPTAGVARWEQRAADVGIGPREITLFCRENDMTEAEFFDQFGDGLISDAVQDLGSGKRNGAR